MTAKESTGSRAGDLWGGLASMLAAFPSAIAYGAKVFDTLGLGAQGALFGILGAVVLGIVAPAVGGAPRLISGPCGPAMGLLSEFSKEHLRAPGAEGGLTAEKIVVLIGLIAVLSAALQLAYGAAGGGKLIKYIPYPVVSGYLSGVGIYILWGQVPQAFGIDKDHVWRQLFTPSAWQAPAVLVALVTATAMVLAPRVTKKVPAVVLGLAAGVICYFLLGFHWTDLHRLDGNRFVLGTFGGGGDFLRGIADRGRAFLDLTGAEWGLVIVPAISLSILLSIDTLKTCVIVDAMTRTRHDSNRVLLGQGIGNCASAVAGGMPGAGQMGPTLVNYNSGGTTRLSGILEGVLALVVFLLLGSWIAWLPFAALAGILMVIGFRMIDRHTLDLLKHPTTRLDFAVVAAVVITAEAVSLIAASGVGLVLSILLFIREQIHVSVIRHKVHGHQVSSKKDRLPEEMAVLQREGPKTTVCELQGTLFFGTTDQLLSALQEDLKTCRYLVLDLKRVQSLDFTAAHMLEQLESSLTDRGAYLLFSSLPASLPSGQDLRTYFDHLGLVKRERNVKVFDEIDDALEWVEDEVLREAGIASAAAGPPLEMGDFDLFREFGKDSIRMLTEILEPRHAAPESKLFAMGDQGEELYLIRRGTVHILLPLPDGRRLHLATFSRGSFFGDMAFLDKRIRSADAVAVDEVDVFVLSRPKFDELSLKHPRAGAMLFARLAKILALRLRRTDAELQALEAS